MESDNPLVGVINPEELYTLRAFKRRLGIADATLRTARRSGLRVHYLHKQGFILGRDWIQYVIDSVPDNRSNSQASQSVDPSNRQSEG